jgi:hypothetical protein
MYSSLKMTGRRNMREGKWRIKRNKLVKNYTFISS